MNNECIAEVVSDLADISLPITDQEKSKLTEEAPYYVIPAPPVPGKVAWSIVPW